MHGGSGRSGSSAACASQRFHGNGKSGSLARFSERKVIEELIRREERAVVCLLALLWDGGWVRFHWLSRHEE